MMTCCSRNNVRSWRTPQTPPTGCSQVELENYLQSQIEPVYSIANKFVFNGIKSPINGSQEVSSLSGTLITNTIP